MGLFSFAESPQLQALLADIAPRGIRDTSFALYFTLAFGVGSLWTAVIRRNHRTSWATSRAADRLLADGDLVRGRGARGHPDPRAKLRAGGAIDVRDRTP